MNYFKDAKWIWLNRCDAVNTYLNFYETFSLGESTGEKIRLYISADSNYAVYLNDRFVDSGQFADYPEYKVYDTLDVTSYLRPGVNRLLIVGYWAGKSTSVYRRGAAGMLYSLDRNGTQICRSGAHTLCAPNPGYQSGEMEVITSQLGYSFAYDANAPVSPLEKADVVEKPFVLFERPIKKLRIGSELPAKPVFCGGFLESAGRGNVGQRMQFAKLSFSERKNARFPSGEGIGFSCGDTEDGICLIVDTQKENTGFLCFDLDVPRECEILIGFGEHLEDLRVRSSIGERTFCFSYLASKGRNVFLYPFRRIGARYLQLHIYSRQATVFYAGIRPTRYPVTLKDAFCCADHLHNKIFEVSRETLRLCMHEHYEDCPWREQALYTMDSRNQMLCGYFVFEDTDFARASLRLMSLSIREDNLLELCSPAEVAITIPSFSAVFLLQLYEHLLHTGDLEFIREMMPAAKRIADGFLQRTEKPSGLLCAYKEIAYWNFYEWQTGLSGTISEIPDEELTYDAPLCAFVSIAYRSLSELYRRLGDSENAAYYRAAHQTMNERFSLFWDSGKQAYASYLDRRGVKSNFAELTNSLILLTGACDNQREHAVRETIKSGTLLPISLSHSIFKYEALLKDPANRRYVFDEIARIWGGMLYKGATSFWETEDGAEAFDHAGSLCHGWSAVPIYFYYQYALRDPDACGLYESRLEKEQREEASPFSPRGMEEETV